tara:strand:+ start:70 stop:738 length:669 start_codon:yes stop_codon:yes gene_type:complete
MEQIDILWYTTFIASLCVIGILAYHLNVLHSRKKNRSLRLEQIRTTKRNAALRLSQAIKTPRASSQLSLGMTSTPSLLEMMDGGAVTSPTTTAAATTATTIASLSNITLSVHTTVPVDTNNNDDDENANLRSIPVVQPKPKVISSLLKTSSIPVETVDSPMIPSVVEVLKAHGSARDRLLQRRTQLLVKKKSKSKPKRLVLTPRQHQKIVRKKSTETLRKMR